MDAAIQSIFALADVAEHVRNDVTGAKVAEEFVVGLVGFLRVTKLLSVPLEVAVDATYERPALDRQDVERNFLELRTRLMTLTMWDSIRLGRSSLTARRPSLLL